MPTRCLDIEPALSRDRAPSGGRHPHAVRGSRRLPYAVRRVDAMLWPRRHSASNSLSATECAASTPTARTGRAAAHRRRGDWRPICMCWPPGLQSGGRGLRVPRCSRSAATRSPRRSRAAMRAPGTQHHRYRPQDRLRAVGRHHPGRRLRRDRRQRGPRSATTGSPRWRTTSTPRSPAPATSGRSSPGPDCGRQRPPTCR